MQSKRALSALTAIALSVAGVAATAAPASAHEFLSSHVWVTLQGNGSSASLSNDDVRTGSVTLTFRGSATAGAAATVVSLRHGATLKRIVSDLTVAASHNAPPAKVIRAITDIEGHVTAYGGADTLPGRAVTDTVVLPHRGNYYILNLADNGLAVSLGRLEASGRPRVHVRHYSATVTLGDETRDVITTSGRLPSSGTIRVRNDGDMIHLLQITPVAKGVTDAQVQAEYNLLLAGKQPTSDPAGLMSRPSALVGSDAISPEHRSYLTYHLPKGTYLLQCFVPDLQTGIPHTFMGMHKVVVIG